MPRFASELVVVSAAPLFPADQPSSFSLKRPVLAVPSVTLSKPKKPRLLSAPHQ